MCTYNIDTDRQITCFVRVPDREMRRQEHPPGIAIYLAILLLLQQHYCISSQALLAGAEEEEEGEYQHHASLRLNRSIFPPEFVFGVGSSAYQVKPCSVSKPFLFLFLLFRLSSPRAVAKVVPMELASRLQPMRTPLSLGDKSSLICCLRQHVNSTIYCAKSHF